MKYNLGKLGEDIACEYLINKQFSILKRNYKSAYGEIDIIAKKHNIIYFIEVKTRKNKNYGSPEESINQKKFLKIQKTALQFLQQNNNISINFDCIKIMILSLIVENGKLKKLKEYYKEI